MLARAPRHPLVMGNINSTINQNMFLRLLLIFSGQYSIVNKSHFGEFLFILTENYDLGLIRFRMTSRIFVINFKWGPKKLQKL